MERFGPSFLHPLVLPVLEWLYLLQRRDYHVGFCWFPAHTGITGNEKADRLAKKAAIRVALPVPFLFMTCTYLYRWQFLPVGRAGETLWVPSLKWG